MNPLIALSGKPLQLPEQPSPVNQLAKVMQLKSAMDQSDVYGMKMDEMRREQASAAALNEAYKGALGPDGAVNRNALFQTVATAGHGSRIPGLQKQFLEVDDKTADITKKKADTDKTQLEVAHKRVDTWGQAMGYVRQNPTPQNAVAAVQHLVTMGVMPREMAQQVLTQVQGDPSPENITRWADMGFRAALSAKDQLPTIQTNDIGGQTVTRAIDPLTGQGTVTGTMQNTQSPNAILQAQTSEANNRRSVGAQYANAAATREIANATREAALEGARLKNDELRGKLEDRSRQKQAGESAIAAQLGVIDKALLHPGRQTATGLSSVADPRNYIPGTDASDFRAVLDQIGGTAFLQAFESLKGGGQITEVEGKKATDAIARLSRAQSDSEFEQSLRDLREVMAAGYKRASGKDFAPAPSAATPKAASGAARIASDAEYNALPSGAVFVGPDGKQRRKP